MPDEFFVNIDLKDIQRVAEKLNLLPAFKAGVLAGAGHVKKVIAVYPPQTDGNMPGPYPKRWYVRGYGPHWALKGGGINREKTSEQLGQRWTYRPTNDGLSAVVGNNASYAEEVQGAQKQKAVHARHGWLTDETVAEQEADNVRDLVSESIREEIKRRGLQP